MWVFVGNIVTGISNYGFTLLLIWFLPGREFSQVASVAALLLVAGTTAQAAVPWVVAREVVNRQSTDLVRHQAIGFSLMIAMVLGSISSVLVLAVSSRYVGVGIQVAIIIAIISFFVAQVGAGYLQGTGRFRLFAVLMTVEALVRLGVGGLLVAAGRGPTGAVSGWAVGAAAGAGIALWLVRKELAWTRHISRGLWAQVCGLGGIQIAVALLSTLDVIMEATLHGVSKPFAGYQAMLVFARIPLFISGALSAVLYPRLVQVQSIKMNTVVSATKLFLLSSGVALVLVSTLPRQIIALVLPIGYSGYSNLLLPLGIAGIACGQINFSTTLLQARSEFRAALLVLVVGVPLGGLLLGFASDSLSRLAWTAACLNLVIAAVLVVLTNSRYRGDQILRLSLGGAAAIAAAIVLFSYLRADTVWWLVSALLLCSIYAAAPRLRFLRYRRGKFTNHRNGESN
jgi:O-antigen/teichoic acid export membrane protein